ncbi:MAG: mannosyltransferase [Thermoleophilales bacterium]|nr:mannosyltransferase [Thermoleophilales bacterium]
MLSTIPHSESTPYLYYAIAWVWAHTVGDGEAALRSLSAVFGVATVAAVWAAARELVSERAALAAAALAALNPFLVWYSQEARAYALLGLLCALSFWLFARALNRPGDARALAWWALASALAIATHYFAALTVIPEAIVLGVLAGRTRAWALACGAVALVALAHVPLLADQRRGGGADWIGDLPLGHRIAEIPKRFMAGEFGNQLNYVFWPALACVVVAALLLWRSSGRERRGGTIGLVVGATGLLVPILLALATLDYVFPRNLIGSLPPLLVALAAAVTTRRAGIALLAVLCALFAVALARTASDDALQRDDWRAVAAELERRHARVVVVSPAIELRTLRHYRGNLSDLIYPGVDTEEVAIVGLTRAPRGDRPIPPPPAPGFKRAEIIDSGTYRIVIFRGPRDVIDPAEAAGSALARGNSAGVADLTR